MIAFKPAAYRPRLAQGSVVIPSGVEQAVSTPSVLGVPQGLLWTAVASAAAWAAIQTGMREKGIKSVAGWVGGVAAGLAAVTSLTGVLAPTVARSFPLRWYA